MSDSAHNLLAVAATVALLVLVIYFTGMIRPVSP